MMFLAALIAAAAPLRAANNLSDSAIFYYENNEFAKAAKCYEKIIASGMQSWILHYNLGSSYYKDNKLGKAILHYEIAKKLNPLNKDLLNNLQISESKVVDKIDTKQIHLQNEIRDFFIYRLSTAGWAWMSIGLIFLCLGLFFLFYITQSPGIKRFYFWSGLVLSAAFVVSLICGFSALEQKTSKTNGVIIAPAVTFYNSPRADESNKKGSQLHEGTKVKILNEEQGWSNIQLFNGNEGWIRTEEVGVY